MSTADAYGATRLLATLRRTLAEHFSREELQGICFDLGVDSEELPGQTKSKVAQELIAHLERRGRILQLVEYLNVVRPSVDWGSLVPAEPEAVPPFKGLQYFQEKDAPIFFGRDALTKLIVSHLEAHRFLAVVGASGSGKSSVIRAGVVPAVRRGQVAYRGQTSEKWPIHIITPGAEPLKTLAATLTRDSESVTATATLIDDLHKHPQSLDLWLHRHLAGDQESRLLLFIDQFEELFTQCNHPDERRCLLDNLVHAIPGGKRGRLCLIIALRADFYAHAVQYEALVPLLETRQRIVEAMSYSELRQAIEGPASADGWQFQPGLVETILQDVGASEGRQPEPGALPLLSHALLETWRRREGRVMTLAGYRDAGGVRRAIATTAEAVYQSLSPDEQAIARSIFLRLTELGEGTEDTRRRATLEELMPRAAAVGVVQDVLQLLVDARLVTTEEAGAEVAHEALIREWPALRQWLDENREGLRLHRQLTDDAQAWMDHERDPSYLYRGTRLAQVLEWTESHQAEPNELEIAFVEASMRRQREQESAKEAQRRRELALERQRAEAAEARRVAETARAEAQSRSASKLRWGAALLAVMLVAVIISLVFVVSSKNEAVQQRENADDQRQKAEQQRETAEHRRRIALAQSLASLSSSILQRQFRDIELATLLAIEAAQINRVESGKLEWLVDGSLRELLTTTHFNNILRGHEGWVFSVAYSPDGQHLASCDSDGLILIWDLDGSGTEPVRLEGHESQVNEVKFSPDGKRLASGGDDRTIYLWDVGDPSAEPTPLLGHRGPVKSLAFSPDGEKLASGGGDPNTGSDPVVRVWDLGNPDTESMSLRGHIGSVNSLAFSPDGEKLASGGDDRTIRIWDLDDPSAEPLLLEGHERRVNSLAFSPDGRKLASGDGDMRSGGDPEVYIWYLDNPGAEPKRLWGHKGAVNSLAFSPNGEYLAIGGGDPTEGGSDPVIRIWDLVSGGVTMLEGHEGSVYSVAFSSDGKRLASGSLDRTIRVWDLGEPTAKPLPLTIHDSRVTTVAFSPDGKQLASCDSDGLIFIWELNGSGTEPKQLRGHEGRVNTVAFSPDGQKLAGGSNRGIIRIWDISEPSADPMRLTDYGASVNSVAFSPDEQHLASGGDDRTIRIWDLGDTNAEPVLLNGVHDGPVNSVAYSPDGQRLASAGGDSTVRIWDLGAPNAEPVLLEGHRSWVNSVIFSPNGQHVASGSGDPVTGGAPMLIIWDLGGPSAEPLELMGHKKTVNSVAYSPDGQRLASASGDSTVRIWDLGDTSAEPVLLNGVHDGPVNSVAYSPDGNWLASVGQDGMIRIWPTLDVLNEKGCRQVWRNLSVSEWEQYLPGEAYRQTCPNLPPHPSTRAGMSGDEG